MAEEPAFDGVLPIRNPASIALKSRQIANTRFEIALATRANRLVQSATERVAGFGLPLTLGLLALKVFEIGRAQGAADGSHVEFHVPRLVG